MEENQELNWEELLSLPEEIEDPKIFNFKEKQRNASLARHAKPGAKEALSEWAKRQGTFNGKKLLGKSKSKSTKQKMSEAGLNRPKEHNEKIAESLKGVKHTDERKKNVSEAVKKNRRKCSYCDLESNLSNIVRHEKNCKKKPV
jgi:hypothetical protein